MTTHVLCEVCGEGHVVSVHGQNEMEHNGAMYAVPFVMSHCEECGSDYASAADMRHNKRAVVARRKELEGLLTGHDICAIRATANLKQAQAAKLFGGGPVAFSKYETNDVTQTASMDKLIRVAAQVPSAMAWLAHYAGEHAIATELCSKEVDRISAVVDATIVGKNTKQVVHAVLKHVLIDSPSCYAKVFVDEVSGEAEFVGSDEGTTSAKLFSFSRFTQKTDAIAMVITDDVPPSNGDSRTMAYRMAA